MIEASARAWTALFPEAARRAKAAQEQKEAAVKAVAFREVADLIEARVETYRSTLTESHRYAIMRLNHERRTLAATLRTKADRLDTADCTCGHQKAGHDRIDFGPFRCLNCKCLQYVPEKP
jgi:hypothetical protein